MAISAAQIKTLREATGAGVLDCRKALEQTNGDFEKAKAWLKDKGLASAAKRTSRSASDGLVGHYIHHNSRVAVLVEVNCETDFVARTDGFKTLTQNIAKHIAMAHPHYIKPEDIPADELAKLRTEFRNEAATTGKPDNILDKIVESKLDNYYQEACLLKQPYVLDDKTTIGEMIQQAIVDLRENIVVRRFVRYELGGE
ncbi:MAG TPA: translation elongation factor Ts [Anaerolineae bacterium]|nr:translation elongation factor Ts [Anaerolineae bacterium]